MNVSYVLIQLTFNCSSKLLPPKLQSCAPTTLRDTALHCFCTALFLHCTVSALFCIKLFCIRLFSILFSIKQFCICSSITSRAALLACIVNSRTSSTINKPHITKIIHDSLKHSKYEL